MRRSFAGLFALVAVPALASFGTNGWDYDLEIDARTWRTESVEWAMNIHPIMPTSAMVQGEIPPPREMWCLSEDPWPENCPAWNYSMRQWLAEYLNVPYDTDFSGLPDFPKECPSSCSVY